MVLAEYKCLLPDPIESLDCMKKYQFIETRKGWVNGFTEVRKLGNARYTIRHTVSKHHHVTNIEDMEVYVKNFLRMNGYETNRSY
jgi:hypothetical protein